MCRISGIIDPSHHIESISALVNKMCDVLENGGPDGEGMYVSPSCKLVFGHRRLALLDLSEAGKQPMTYDEQRLVVTYNGEIYNYPELKKELEACGYHFKTVCDTEMILIAYAAWGTDSFKRFKGMFAFALYDRDAKKVFLVRDPSGIKPLYYYCAGNKLYFASEVKALKIFPFLNNEEQKAKVFLLAYGHIPEPFTILKDVWMLPKGNVLTFEMESGKVNFSTFLEFGFEEMNTTKVEAHKIINEKLTTSIKRHLLSDAPIGVFLSGGIDSSIVALLAHQFSGNHLNTLSLYFDEANYSEKKFQDIVISSIQCKHRQFLLKGDEFSAQLENVIADMDMPSIDGMNTWFICKYAKEMGLKAVLSGVGSDEIFGGYPSFRRMNSLKFLKNLPSIFLMSSRFLGINKLRRIEYLRIPGSIGAYLFLRGIYLPCDISKILSIPEKEIWEILKNSPVLPNITSLSAGNKASWLEMNMYMQNQLLRDSDVMSMAHGIEIRVPFLDVDLIESSIRIQSKTKYSGERPKQILIDSFKRLLPRPIWDRPKMGFAFPFKEWLKGNNYIESIMNKTDLYTEKYTGFQNGNVAWAEIMAILVLESKIK